MFAAVKEQVQVGPAENDLKKEETSTNLLSHWELWSQRWVRATP